MSELVSLEKRQSWNAIWKHIEHSSNETKGEYITPNYQSIGDLLLSTVTNENYFDFKPLNPGRLRSSHVSLHRPPHVNIVAESNYRYQLVNLIYANNCS
jgi:hypothetical protein